MNHKPTSKASPASEAKRVGRFGVIGALNTAIDFMFYNLFSIAGLSLLVSNIFSTTIAMIFSFMANKRVVFGAHTHQVSYQAIKFFLITAFGLWVIQTSVIQLLTQSFSFGHFSISFHAPIAIILAIAHSLGLNHTFSDSFMVKNSAKAIAVIFSMTWNYLMYQNIVFLKQSKA